MAKPEQANYSYPFKCAPFQAQKHTSQSNNVLNKTATRKAQLIRKELAWVIQMKNVMLSNFVILAICLSVSAYSEPYQLGTVIDTNGSKVTVSGSGYTKLTLLKFATNMSGVIYLKGSVSVPEGSANLVMWSKVKGNQYFSKIPELQGFQSRSLTSFTIPFNAENEVVTEVTLEIELPQGGKIILDNVSISTG